ncbi:MAG: hypothetical protein M3483_02210 [Gemmatimonadota bacterium]|nr:hypothetical protein [Gemmatimonadota bacterium]
MRRVTVPLAAAGALLVLGACTPIVTHPPRVEPGLAFGGVAGVNVVGLASGSGASATHLAPIHPYLRYGWRPASDRWGALVEVGLAPTGLRTDLFTQLATSQEAADFGVGVIVGATEKMPYFQWGRSSPEGWGWYFTQGLAFLAETGFLNPDDRPRSVLWMPGYTRSRAGRRADVRWNFTAGIGGQEMTVCEPCRREVSKVFIGIVAVVVELHR